MIRKIVAVTVAAVLVLAAGNALAAWGAKELENETLAVNFAGEVSRGGYKIVATKELKGWIDQKKPMLIVDTMPYEDSYKKQHIPGAVQMEFPIPEMTSLDDKTKAAYNLRGLRVAMKTPKLLILGLVRFAVAVLITIIAAGLTLVYHKEILGVMWAKPASQWIVWLWYLISWVLALFLLGSLGHIVLSCLANTLSRTHHGLHVTNY